MISDNNKKFEAYCCKYCGAEFSEDSLNDFLKGIKILVCESCGTENKSKISKFRTIKKKRVPNLKK